MVRSIILSLIITSLTALIIYFISGEVEIPALAGILIALILFNFLRGSKK